MKTPREWINNDRGHICWYRSIDCSMTPNSHKELKDLSSIAGLSPQVAPLYAASKPPHSGPPKLKKMEKVTKT